MMCTPEPRASFGSDPRRRSLSSEGRRRSIGGLGGGAGELQRIDELPSIEVARRGGVESAGAISGGGLVPVV
jgi:hypothetical protein